MNTEFKERSALKVPILKVLNKVYAPSTLVELKFGRYDLAFKTDNQGRPILLFMGIKGENGNIRGERYVRTFKTNGNGEIVKDHWEHKGKATPGW